MAGDSEVSPGSFHPFEVSATHLVYVGLGLFIVLFGMFSLFIKERLYLGEAPLAAVFGIIVGPACLSLFNPAHWARTTGETPGGHITNEISLEIFRVTIALSVFAVGVELPKKYLLRHWRSIFFLLGPVMIYGWMITAAFMYALIPGLDFLNSLVVASCVTPTDPILAQAVVGGPWAEKHVPAHLRHMLMCESGCNDGAAFPFLYLALFLTLNRDNTGKAIAEWFYDALAYQIIFGTLLGALIGWLARKLMRFSERHKLVDRESFVAQYVSLAIASMGVNVLLGSDDLLAAFACGSAFAWDGWFTKQTEDSNFSSIVDLLFNVAVFIYIGALMPFREWVGGEEEQPNTLNLWRLFVLTICVLLTKRIPVVLALWRWIPDIKTFREAIFAGHFGPIGVGAVFIATLARTQLPEEIPSPPESTNDVLALVVQPVIYFFVLCSVAVHGLTIPFFAFSKNASRMTRTWSRHPSINLDREPTWVSRLRRNKTGEKMSPDEEGGMTEIERVLNAQLRQIGRGAIGGDAEKDIDQTDTEQDTGDSSQTAPAKQSNYGHAQSYDHDGYDNYASNGDNDDADWGGDDTVEMRRYREKQLAKKAQEYAELRKLQQGYDKTDDGSQRDQDGHDGDIGSAAMLDEERGPMDRDLPRTREEKERDYSEDLANKEGLAKWGTSTGDKSDQAPDVAAAQDDPSTQWPRTYSWVEGNKIVIEHQQSSCSEAETHVIPLMENERELVAASEHPGHTWAMQHADALERHVGLKSVSNWHPSETLTHLISHRIPTLYQEHLQRKSRPRRRPSVAETQEERDQRSSMILNTVSWASQQAGQRDQNITHSKTSPLQSQSHRNNKPRPPSPPEAPITGWLAPRPKYRGTSSPNRSVSPSGSGSNSQIRKKVHKCASDSRRRALTRKALAGRVSLASRQEDDRHIEEVIESSDKLDRASTGFSRTSSAGGLGGATTSSKSSIPRTTTTSSTGSSQLNDPKSRMLSERSGSGRGVQWVDINDHDHDHQNSSSLANTSGTTQTYPQISRGRLRSDNSKEEMDMSERNPRKSRITSFFSSLASGRSSPVPEVSHRSETPQKNTTDDDSKFPRSLSTEQPESLRPAVPTRIVGTSAPLSEGGILSTDTYANDTQPSRTESVNDTDNGANDRGVTFDV